MDGLVAGDIGDGEDCHNVLNHVRIFHNRYRKSSSLVVVLVLDGGRGELDKSITMTRIPVSISTLISTLMASARR